MYRAAIWRLGFKIDSLAGEANELAAEAMAAASSGLATAAAKNESGVSRRAFSFHCACKLRIPS